jgi:hypothetical protein
MKTYEILGWLGIVFLTLGFAFIGFLQLKNFFKVGPLKHLIADLNNKDRIFAKISLFFLILGGLLLIAGLITKP